MLFGDKTQNNIMIDLKRAVNPDVGTGEGTLLDHAFRGAAAEFEQAYIGLGLVEKNGYALTADREHLILRAKERGMEPYPATRAVWKAELNIDAEPGMRFSAGDLTYACIERMGGGQCRLECEQPGARGNSKRDGLAPIEYAEGFESGVLAELLYPARDEEETEAFRERYISAVSSAQAFGGNRAQYKAAMHELPGVGACKAYRVTERERRIRIYFLDSGHKTPDAELVSRVQDVMDPIGRQGCGEGKAAIFHVVDVFPCASESVDIEAEITLDTGYSWEDVLPGVREMVDDYFLELARGWEYEDCITVRILRVNAAIACVEGIVDVQNTALNGKEENLVLGPDRVPVMGGIECRQ